MDIDIEKMIGGGAFGKVFAGKVGGEICAVKCPAAMEEEDWGLVAELQVLTQIAHKNVVRFICK